MLSQECGSKNAGVAGYAEAFGIRAIGKAGKYLGQLFKKRCTSKVKEKYNFSNKIGVNYEYEEGDSL